MILVFDGFWTIKNIVILRNKNLMLKIKYNYYRTEILTFRLNFEGLHKLDYILKNLYVRLKEMYQRKPTWNQQLTK